MIAARLQAIAERIGVSREALLTMSFCEVAERLEAAQEDALPGLPRCDGGNSSAPFDGMAPARCEGGATETVGEHRFCARGAASARRWTAKEDE